MWTTIKTTDIHLILNAFLPAAWANPGKFDLECYQSNGWLLQWVSWQPSVAAAHQVEQSLH